MTEFDEHGRPLGQECADELTTLTGMLDFQRATLEWKTRGLDAAALTATIPTSTMTLGGLLKHLAKVEDYWFNMRAFGNPRAEPWRSVDWEADRDWDWHSAAADSPDALRALWGEAVERSRQLCAAGLPDGGLESIAAPRGETTPPNLRWIYCHMIEEYARHNGHADILREAVDGQVGE